MDPVIDYIVINDNDNEGVNIKVNLLYFTSVRCNLYELCLCLCLCLSGVTTVQLPRLYLVEALVRHV